MAVKDELYQLADKMNADPVHIKDEKNRVFQVDLEESGPIQILLKEGKVIVEEGASHEPEVTLKLSDKNFSKLLKDDLNTTMAFMTGSLKVDGKMGLALKLQEIVKKYQ
ncbi:SCP2 sterol-binding domain-containing protein [Cytobacillus oceanisediminis]|jgi:putative sterol carrier protein|uniref:Sterol carrier protein n=1 Tax=Cytobacillus oceanisediminis 2691 TaxID=1196031 RepID=A0A161JB69_9BACI|nr:SCP2 sterol-binding domain-containing protein [Cytobacillus oceanisediminis]AND38575.1 sterol carrier protein [Cytobacillus oceanisediminis 2691]MCM3241854.1 SCP2 sterol-binding domain-containing protein [Cytobacillus oceanisediminis]MCM3403854.1 SCP2 sterol-binding domain-containing protein [Cytobacillus oceanisediminis]MDK7668752.1 SCP2 sterol-binding domain-containing protein [Cytobacillus oceanisediminis]